jgi:hypothetical protein
MFCFEEAIFLSQLIVNFTRCLRLAYYFIRLSGLSRAKLKPLALTQEVRKANELFDEHLSRELIFVFHFHVNPS